MQATNYEKTLIGLLYEWPTTAAEGRYAGVHRVHTALIHDGINIKLSVVQAAAVRDRSTPVARMSVPSSCLSQEPP